MYVSLREVNGDCWDQSLSAGVVNVKYVEMHGKEGSILIFLGSVYVSIFRGRLIAYIFRI